jgi:hypothetical protein
MALRAATGTIGRDILATAEGATRDQSRFGALNSDPARASAVRPWCSGYTIIKIDISFYA